MPPRARRTLGLFTPRCEALGHHRDAATVIHDGGTLRARCTRCGAPLVLKVGGWRTD